MKILVVDDDPLIRDSLSYSLAKEGFQVLVAASGEAALGEARLGRPDLAILDVGLPGMDGLEVCRILQAEMNLPTIMLTARDQEIDKVLGLRLGADDYVTKPFSTTELLARIQAVLRRTQPAHHTRERIEVGEIVVDVAAHEVRVRGQLLKLSPKEFALLRLLASNPGRVLERHFLLDTVWGEGWIGEPKTLDVHIQWLRDKIESDPSRPRFIHTVRGIGYKFALPSKPDA